VKKAIDAKRATEHRRDGEWDRREWNRRDDDKKDEKKELRDAGSGVSPAVIFSRRHLIPGLKGHFSEIRLAFVS
jgi:hypothetical protein